jgi:hypothetical protein
VKSRLRADIGFVLTQFRPRGSEELRRRALLPSWIRFFCWIFLFASAAVPSAFIMSAFEDTPVTFAIFGLQHTGSSLDFSAIIIALLLMLAGTAAYGLLWGRVWGIDAGLGIGFVGLAFSLVAEVSALLRVGAGAGAHFPVDPLFQLPFIVQLWRRQKAWEQSTIPDSETHAA